MNITPDIHTAILIANRFAVAHQSAETAVNALNTLYHNIFADMVDAELKQDIFSAMERMRDVVRATDFNNMGEYVKQTTSNETTSTKMSSDQMIESVVAKYKNACKLYQHAKTNTAMSCHAAQMDAFSQTLISFGMSHEQIAELSK